MNKSALLGFVLFFVVSISTVRSGAALEPQRPNQSSFVMRAIFHEDALWVLTDAGQLSRLRDDRKGWAEETLPEPVLDMCVQGNQLVVITGQRDHPKSWTMRHLVSGHWSATGSVETAGDSVIAMTCDALTVTLLTNNRLIELGAHTQHAVRLSGKLPSGVVTSIYPTGDEVLVGVNAGEWGGGLRRLERSTGRISQIDDRLINVNMDPVNAIVADPWKPNCVVIAVGLVHFMPSGRIVQVCGNEVKELYSKPYYYKREGVAEATPSEFGTIAFFGLMREENSLLAAGIDGLYRIEADGTAHHQPLPNFETIGSIPLSFDVPSAVLVVTEINRRRSVSGGAPLLVPRQ